MIFEHACRKQMRNTDLGTLGEDMKSLYFFTSRFPNYLTFCAKENNILDRFN